MPIMDGCTATKTIRQTLYDKGEDQPLIIGATGQTEQEYVNNAIKHGMNTVFSKPLDYKVIKKVIQKLNYI